MALSPESLLADRRAKKTASTRHIIQHNFTDDNINAHTNISAIEVWSVWSSQFFNATYAVTRKARKIACNCETKTWIFF